MALNHIQITNAKPRDKAFKLADSDGLYLFVQPNGAKLWRMNYRHLARQKTLYFGAWPEVGIAAARQLREKAREQIAAGLDPAAEKRVENLARKVAADNTFKTIAEEWVGKNEREGRAAITLDKIRWLLGMAYPMIGTLPISKISPQEVLAVLRKVEATGRYESARRMRSVLSRVFRYGIATAAKGSIRTASRRTARRPSRDPRHSRDIVPRDRRGVRQPRANQGDRATQ